MAPPSKFDPDYCRQAQKLCELGATDLELAAFFEVAGSTIQLWKLNHPEFAEALRIGKEPADERVKRALYQRAVGYSYEAQKIFQYEGRPVVVDYVEHVPPDIRAIEFWMVNRSDWVMRSKTEVTGADGGPLQATINLTIG